MQNGIFLCKQLITHRTLVFIRIGWVKLKTGDFLWASQDFIHSLAPLAVSQSMLKGRTGSLEWDGPRVNGPVGTFHGLWATPVYRTSNSTLISLTTADGVKDHSKKDAVFPQLKGSPLGICVSFL